MITKKEAVIRVFDDLAEKRSWEFLYSGRLNRTTYNFMSRLRAAQNLIEPHLADGRNVLDIGCGTGDLVTFCVSKGAKYCGVDLSEKMIQRASSLYGVQLKEGRAKFLVGDCEKLQFSDSEFDIVLAIGLIEYLPDPTAFLAETVRVLKNGGVLLLTVPYKECIDSKIRAALKPFARLLFPIYAKCRKQALVGMSDVKHYNYNEAELDTILESNGFRRIDERFTNFHLIPYPLDHFIPRMYMRMSESVDTSGRGGKHRRWASNYLALFKKGKP